MLALNFLLIFRAVLLFSELFSFAVWTMLRPKSKIEMDFDKARSLGGAVSTFLSKIMPVTSTVDVDLSKGHLPSAIVGSQMEAMEKLVSPLVWFSQPDGLEFYTAFFNLATHMAPSH